MDDTQYAKALQALKPRLPEACRSARESRYNGGRFTLKLSVLSLEEAQLVKSLYTELLTFFERIRREDVFTEAQLAYIHDFACAGIFLDLAQELFERLEAFDNKRGRAVSAVLYELSCGALRSLCTELERARAGNVQPLQAQVLFYLARDHLKIMRMALLDIDPERRGRDAARNLHSVDLLLEKWSTRQYHHGDKALAVSLHHEFRGFVAERCLEFAELDSLFYHILNNAARYAEPAQLRIGVRQTQDNNNLLWTFANPISAEQVERLRAIEAAHGNLFAYGAGSGSGVGLALVASAIAYAYGFDEAHEAVQEGYCGWQVEGDCFLLWFHWPMVGEG